MLLVRGPASKTVSSPGVLVFSGTLWELSYNVVHYFVRSFRGVKCTCYTVLSDHHDTHLFGARFFMIFPAFFHISTAYTTVVVRDWLDVVLCHRD